MERSRSWPRLPSTGTLCRPVKPRPFNCRKWFPQLRRITVPHSDHLYDNAWRGFVMAVVMNVEVDGKHFSLNRQAAIDIAPPLEIARS